MHPYLVLAHEVTGAAHPAELPQLASLHLHCAVSGRCWNCGRDEAGLPPRGQIRTIR